MKVDIEAVNQLQKKATEHALLDRVYFWIIDRYTRNWHEFKWSDRFVWKGAVYVVPEFIGYAVFFAIFLMLAAIGFRKYGEARTYVFFMLLILWRLQAMIKLLGQLNRKL